MKFRILRALSLAAFGALIISGCAAPDAEPAPSLTPGQVEGNQRDYESATAVAACLEERGWDVNVTPEGGWGIEVEMDEAQADVYREDFNACLEETGMGDVQMDEELANYLYDNHLRVLDCLEGAGYSVEEPPSRAGFVSTLLEDPSKAPDPFALVPEADRSDAVFACPQ